MYGVLEGREYTKETFILFFAVKTWTWRLAHWAKSKAFIIQISMGTKREPRSSPKFGPNFANKAIRNSQYFCSIILFKEIYWSRVNLQYCVSFQYTAKWFSYIYISPFFFRFFSHIGHYRVFSRFPCARQKDLFSYLSCL